MRNIRKHKRFKFDSVGLSSKMSSVGNVQLIDISQGGVALNADKKLNIGKECQMMLGYEGNHINVKGIVVRSELTNIEERSDGESVSIYSVGIVFKDESAGTVKDFLDSIENNKKTPLPVQAGWSYRDVLFSITTPDEIALKLPTEFGIKEISQSGIIIKTAHQLNIDSMVLLELSLNACDPVSFVGKVVSFRMPQDKGHANYEIGVEFSELTDRDRSLLIRFIDRMKDI